MNRYSYLEDGILKADPDTFQEVVEIVDEFYHRENTPGTRWELEQKLMKFFEDLYYQDIAEDIYIPVIESKENKIDVKFIAKAND